METIDAPEIDDLVALIERGNADQRARLNACEGVTPALMMARCREAARQIARVAPDLGPVLGVCWGAELRLPGEPRASAMTAFGADELDELTLALGLYDHLCGIEPRPDPNGDLPAVEGDVRIRLHIAAPSGEVQRRIESVVAGDDSIDVVTRRCCHELAAQLLSVAPHVKAIFGLVAGFDYPFYYWPGVSIGVEDLDGDDAFALGESIFERHLAARARSNRTN